jgi:isopenicillin N synthase-like dioxygenase
LVIAAQDEVGGLFVRPPYQGETYANWEKSAAGMKEDDEGWVYVPPVSDTFTVFPGKQHNLKLLSYEQTKRLTNIHQVT